MPRAVGARATIVNDAVSAALEETLHCSSAGDNFAGLRERFPDIGEFLEE